MSKKIELSDLNITKKEFINSWEQLPKRELKEKLNISTDVIDRIAKELQLGIKKSINASNITQADLDAYPVERLQKYHLKNTHNNVKKIFKRYHKIYNLYSTKSFETMIKFYQKEHSIEFLSLGEYRKTKDSKRKIKLDKTDTKKFKSMWQSTNYFQIDVLNEFNISATTAQRISREHQFGSKAQLHNQSQKETEIRNFIKELDDVVVNNCKQFISPKEIDILSHKFKFGIEFNGLISHSAGYTGYLDKPDNYEIKNKHIFKTEKTEERGYQLFHIFEDEWIDSIKKEIWKSLLYNKMNVSKKIPARKTNVREITPKEAQEFLELNHLQGHSNARVKIGLFHQEELVSVMTFSTPRFNTRYEYELIRFASKTGCVIQGGAGKLLKYFERKYNPKSIISYANRRWSQGNVYRKLGFNEQTPSSPNYFYFHYKENILYHRAKFQKHKLLNILGDFDDSRTETENMFRNGYRKIYDSGNLVFTKHYDL